MMDYEIDIEEHDVLDNPLIKKVFPDISVIKKEITQYFEEDSSAQKEPELAETHEDQEQSRFNLENNILGNSDAPSEVEQTSNALKLSPRTNTEIQDDEKKYVSSLDLNLETLGDSRDDRHSNFNSNLNIVGSKPHKVTQNGSRDDTVCSQNNLDEKLILSSNLVQDNIKNVDENQNHGDTVKLKQIKIILQDIKSYLNQNGRYCRLCCRLFLSKKALDNHKNRVHNNKVINNKLFAKQNSINETGHKCVICASYFCNKSNLYRHYRNVHNKKIKVKGKNNTKFKISNSNNTSNNKKTNTLDMMNNVKIKSEKQKKAENSVSAAEVISNVSICEEKHQTSSLKTNDNNCVSKISKTVDDLKDLKVNTVEKMPVIIQQNSNQIITVSEKLSSDNKRKDDAIEDNETKNVTDAENSKSTASNLCLHCKIVFPDQKSLIEHMYEILEPKKKTTEQINNAASSSSTKEEDEKLLFVCRQCSYYLPSSNAYFSHMTRNHKTVTCLDVNKEKYNAQCKYCSYKSSNIATHNKHIHSYHIDLMFLRIENEKEDAETKQNNEYYNTVAINNFNSFALESVLFECSKCSVCFLSSNIARNHIQHTELLNDWKCSMCQHVFKEQYKELHLKQHAFSKNINVIKLNEPPCNNILYNCTKCAIHFTEKRYQEHFSNCGSNTTDSSYCMICDILVDKTGMNNHKTQHKHLKEISDFVIIDSNLLTEKVTNLKRKSTGIECEVKPKKKLCEPSSCLTYCHICNSFVSGLGLKNKNHINGTCAHTPKYSCNDCGLIFTSSILQIHKEKHDENKNITLQDYIFFDLQGNQIRPPIPEYPHCKLCKVHFLRKKSIYRHVCDEINYLTCDICNIKFAEKTYKLHMSFHSYVIKENSLSSVRSNSPKQLSDLSITNRNILDKTPHDSNAHASLSVHNVIESESQLNTELTKGTTEIKNHIIEPKVQETNDSDESLNTVVQKNYSTDIDEKLVPYDSCLVVLYTCKTCGVSVESYDEVIKHCQTHYSAEKNYIATVSKCKQCSLKFDNNSYADHQRRVHSTVSKIQIQKFDPSYYTMKNMIWVNHVFQNLPEKVVKELLKYSIYQHEHRIQFERIQKGSTLLYLYKCASCGSFADASCVYKHTEGPCVTSRYPCKFCALPFISLFSRTIHENLHKQITKRLTKKSFNIVLFNQHKDRDLNKRILCTTNQYILYQCRNCDSIVDKLMYSDHVCDRNSLVKCTTCGLLIDKDDVASHLTKHTDLGNFNSENFKVILIGRKDDIMNDKTITTKLPSGFSGIVYDYTFYKCGICQMCLKKHESIENHFCLPHFELDKTACLKCNLYFPSGNLKQHTKQHKTDPDFIKENMNVITFNNHLPIIQYSYDSNESPKHGNDKTINEMSQVLNSQNCIEKTETDKTDTKNCSDNEDHRQSEKNAVENSIYIEDDDNQQDELIAEKTVNPNDKNKSNNENNHNNNAHKSDMENAMDANRDLEILYKCNCGLHFLNKQKATNHSKRCQPKVKQHKQSCSKCHFLFNPSELFTHLVIHHREKSQEQHFNVIEISDKKIMTRNQSRKN